jgi:hypothetical protein
MPTYKTGDMWQHYNKADLFLITTNSFIKADGELTMGAGIAKEAKERFPSLPLQAGNIVKQYCGHLGKYGLYVSKHWPATKLGLFQTKFHWRDSADIDLIKRSVTMLDFWLIGRDDKTVCFNFPGIGNGGLDRDIVKPLLDVLPSNVFIFER